MKINWYIYTTILHYGFNNEEIVKLNKRIKIGQNNDHKFNPLQKIHYLVKIYEFKHIGILKILIKKKSKMN